MLYKQLPCSASCGFWCHFWTINNFFYKLLKISSTSFHSLSFKWFPFFTELLHDLSCVTILNKHFMKWWKCFGVFFLYSWIKVSYWTETRWKVVARMSCLMSVFALLKYEFFKAVRDIVMGWSGSHYFVIASSPAWCRWGLVLVDGFIFRKSLSCVTCLPSLSL